MKKLILLSALLIFACTHYDNEGNPCVYEPTLTTEAATDITYTSATLNGVISIVRENCYVPSSEQGFVYSTEIQPTLEGVQVNVNGTSISTTIQGLESNTTYYVRAFLTNNIGDFYGNEIEFTTEEILLINCDGNPVPAPIVYGTQEWTVENTCNITYRDGTPIPQATEPNWTTAGAWCYYDNDPTKGKLYNWYAVMGIHDNDPSTPNKEFAPEGWHIPSYAEWTTLENHLIANGYNWDGTTTENKIGKAMSSVTGWDNSNTPGSPGWDQSLNNSSGFNAFPEGLRTLYGPFDNENKEAYFWSSTELDSLFAWGRRLNVYTYNFGRLNDYKQKCYSVRFVRD
tara:strand:+ start:31 stop:1056 length:1026 start_codon:yes stop_codon:yes gene_type:complete